MAELTFKDFSGGWFPGDDPINGRKNGALQLENLELDSNGALTLSGGTAVVQSGYPSNAHTLFSRLINGARHDYSLLADGSGYRDATSLFSTGGDAAIGAFGTAFNYTLICSGDKRVKDSGTAIVNLGIAAPTAAPTASFGAQPKTLFADFLNLSILSHSTGCVPYIVSGVLQIHCDTSGDFIVQTYNNPSFNPGPFDLSHLSQSTNVGVATDDDYFTRLSYAANPSGRSLQIDINLETQGASLTQANNYYTYFIPDISKLDFLQTGVFIVKLRRSDFVRVGSGTMGWESTYGFRFTYNGGTSGEVVNIIGSDLAGNSFYFFGGSHAQKGQYQFYQVNVNNTGSYLAKSSPGPVSIPITVDMAQIQITPYVTGLDSQVNEVWIYAIGGLLDAPYRILVITTPYAAHYDLLGDQEVLTLNIKLNLNLVSIASSSISDKILAILGPINGRWYYFTTNFMYPSDINDPDLVDVSIAIRTTGSSSEIFLWAKQTGPNTVLVGTSVDVYNLGGTFATFPDGSIDAYYLGTGCKYPPITYDAEIYGGSVYYLAADGWRVINGSGQASFTGNTNASLISPNLDRLYRGETVSSYQPPNLSGIPGSVRFPIVIAKNKLWCFITGLTVARIEVYDFVRQYWRVVVYQLGAVSAATHTQDGQILAFFSADKKLREIDYQTSRLIDGSGKQTIKLLSLVNDGTLPRNRKDSETFKIRCASSDGINCSLIPDGSSTPTTFGTAAPTSEVTDKFFDLSQVALLAIVKTYQLQLIATVSAFTFVDAIVYFNPRPEQVTFLKLLNTNFESAAKKRIRNWPLVIDSLGNDVQLRDTADNSPIGDNPQIIQTTHKDTVNVFYKTDVFGIDYGSTLYCQNGLFEYYGRLNPEIVQVLPVAKRFDQLGPEELFRYGKIKQVEFRLLPFSGTVMPFTIYFNDSTNISESFSMIDGKDAPYYIMLPKGTSGNVVRIELGPTDFNFHRLATRVQVTRSGRDTELEWISL